MSRFQLTLLILAALVAGGAWYAGRAPGSEALHPEDPPLVGGPKGAATLQIEESAARAPRAATETVEPPAPGLDPIVVTGTLRDSYGDPRRHHLVAILQGAGPPPSRPVEWMSLPHARTDLLGEFVLHPPAPGSYRLFVGYGGRITFEADRMTHLASGEAAHVDIVMAAPSRLLIEVHDPPGAVPTPPYSVTIYRESSMLDSERPLPPQTSEFTLPDLDDPSIDNEMREELRVAIELQAIEMTPEQRAAMARRLQVVPKGWRMDRSAVLDSQRHLLFEFLPVGEELRFAVSRAGEAFQVDGSAWLDGRLPTRVRIDLPASPADGENTDERPRSARATVSPVALPRTPLEPGCTWTTTGK